MNKFLWFLFVFFMCSISVVYAYCSITGYACSLENLKNESQIQFDEFRTNLDNYFTKNPLEKNYLSKGFDVKHYHELFTFNTIV